MAADAEPEEAEAEVVTCLGCGTEQGLELRQVGDQTIALCPFCRDTAELLKVLGKRAGMTVLQRFRGALQRAFPR